VSEQVNTAPRGDSCRKDKLRDGNGSLGSWSKVRGQNAQRFSRAVGSFYQRNGAGEDSPRERETGAVHEQGTATLSRGRLGPGRVGRRRALIRPRSSSYPTLLSTSVLAFLLATSDCFADTHHSQMTIWEPDRCKHALPVFAGRLAVWPPCPKTHDAPKSLWASSLYARVPYARPLTHERHNRNSNQNAEFLGPLAHGAPAGSIGVHTLLSRHRIMPGGKSCGWSSCRTCISRRCDIDACHPHLISTRTPDSVCLRDTHSTSFDRQVIYPWLASRLPHGS
jgi:hypothetical protein